MSNKQNRNTDGDGNHVVNDVLVDFHHSREAKNASKEGNWREGSIRNVKI